MMVKGDYKNVRIGPQEIKTPKDWRTINLKEICDICYGKEQSEVENENGAYPILGTGGIISYADDYLYDKPSVLIGRKGTIDQPQFIEKPFWTIDTLFYTKIKENAYPKWLFYYLSYYDLSLLNEATGVPSLSRKNLYNMSIPTPNKREQKKIATILSSVDKAIEKTDEVIEESNQLKKGLMQELLTKGIGHDEFKEVRIGPYTLEIPLSWDVEPLKAICDFKQGYQIPRSKQIQEKEDGYKRFLYITDFFSDRKKLFVKDKEKYYYIKEKDIAVANTGNTCGKAFRGANGILSNNMFKIFYAESILNNDYLFSFLKSPIYKKQLNTILNSGSQPHLGHKNMGNIRIPLPSLDEQKKIAFVLSSVNTKIQKEQEYKKELETLKKGLMQKLLTGEVRVKVDNEEV